MNKADEIPLSYLIDAYNELKSSYKVAKKFNTSATAIKRILKKHGILRNQKIAALERDNSFAGKYERTETHRQILSDSAKTKIGSKNPFFGKKHSQKTKEIISQARTEYTGKRNPNYKNGSYERRPRDFKQAEFTRLRNFVFNRDNYTCNYCGSMGGHLHAHHKIPYWVCKEAYLDSFNLIAVCTKCHFSKAHLGNWNFFDTKIIEDTLIEKYFLDRKRLNELATTKK